MIPRQARADLPLSAFRTGLVKLTGSAYTLPVFFMSRISIISIVAVTLLAAGTAYWLNASEGERSRAERPRTWPKPTEPPPASPNYTDVKESVPSEADIERTTGLSEGNIFQGELLLEQLFSGRPMPGAGYGTPVRGLWICGSSTHPGGAISGAPGRNAAREVLRAWKRVA